MARSATAFCVPSAVATDATSRQHRDRRRHVGADPLAERTSIVSEVHAPITCTLRGHPEDPAEQLCLDFDIDFSHRDRSLEVRDGWFLWSAEHHTDHQCAGHRGLSARTQRPIRHGQR
jgi:hypothetical protein